MEQVNTNSSSEETNTNIDQCFVPNHKRTSSKSKPSLMDLITGTDVTMGIDNLAEHKLNYNNLEISPSSSSTFTSNESDVELEDTSLNCYNLHMLNKLHLDHQFLTEQNRNLIRELQFAKMTAQALKSIIQQKDEQLFQLAQDMPLTSLLPMNGQSLTTTNSNENSKHSQISAIMKRTHNQPNLPQTVPANSTSKLKMPFRLRHLAASRSHQ